MMNKFLTFLFVSSALVLSGCGNTPSLTTELNETLGDSGEGKTLSETPDTMTPEGSIVSYLETNNICGNATKLFANIAVLGEKSLDNGEMEYYVETRGEGYKIDERGNISDDCGFAIPMRFVISEEDGHIYTIKEQEEAKDGGDYGESIKQMFPKEAIEKLDNEDYEYRDSRSLLEMAEEYYGETLIPTEKNNFNCNFCDKKWYYTPNEEEDGKSNELVFKYTSEDNGNHTIYFGGDGVFEAEGSWDAGTGNWYFGKDENTVIVEDSHADHIYSRYIITNWDENHLNTILEIIQKM